MNRMRVALIGILAIVFAVVVYPSGFVRAVRTAWSKTFTPPTTPEEQETK